jgi:hypothetical protein
MCLRTEQLHLLTGRDSSTGNITVSCCLELMDMCEDKLSQNALSFEI